ncbi:MAG: two-component system response regulator [Cycloclasticus sp. symbiont of Poecilosclerida sp. M]|nr:MAG: two-component system response regulator [Cycloclasticus sp. symbiont of Poecilosclerida sp. M]
MKISKIMVIDDSKTIRKSVELYMKESGYEVILANDGFDALSKISEHNPDLIFVDVTMPRLDGYQTCALIKQSHQYKNTPVLMLSSKGGLFDRAKGRLVGADDYLIKPFTKNSLLATVDKYSQQEVAVNQGGI